MKKFMLIVATIVALLLCGTVSAQKYTVKNGTVVVSPVTHDTTKVADKVFASKDGKTFYISTRGSVYYWKTSKKTGKQYKCYVKQS